MTLTITVPLYAAQLGQLQLQYVTPDLEARVDFGLDVRGTDYNSCNIDSRPSIDLHCDIVSYSLFDSCTRI